jgi:hypothetical protein
LKIECKSKYPNVKNFFQKHFFSKESCSSFTVSDDEEPPGDTAALPQPVCGQMTDAGQFGYAALCAMCLHQLYQKPCHT